jgi:YHS domain-containing protein
MNERRQDAETGPRTDDDGLKTRHGRLVTEDDAVALPTAQAVHDPVCHMDIEADDAAGSIERDGLTYYFCSEACRDAFEREPERIIEAERSYAHTV